MRSTSPTRQPFLYGLGLGLCLGAAGACSHDKPAAKPAPRSSGGGENALDRVERGANRVHEDFKREVKSAAEVVDEKANAAVGEGRKAVHKVVDAVDGNDSNATPQKPEQKPERKSGDSASQP